jgi:hypothetical protein
MQVISLSDKIVVCDYFLKSSIQRQA